MGNKPLRPCRYPGCTILTDGAYCLRHRPAPKPDSRSEEAKTWRWMYKTDAWTKRLRPDQLAREPWCAECARIGFRVRATDVDHIVDHKGDPELFFDSGNLQSLCHSCHSRKTMQDMQKNSRKKLRR